MAPGFSKESFATGVAATIGSQSHGGSNGAASDPSHGGSNGAASDPATSLSYAEVLGAGKSTARTADWISMLGESSMPYHKRTVKDGKVSVLLPQTVCDL